MNTMTELGVYILGAVALCLLAAAGIAFDTYNVVLCAVVSAGAAYATQVAAVWRSLGFAWAAAVNLAGFAVALLAWTYGAFLLF